MQGDFALHHWYLYPNESHNSDGKHITYLQRSTCNERRFRACDPILYDALVALIGDDERHICRVRSSGILPPDTIYYEDNLSYQPRDRRDARQKLRERWLWQALHVACDGDIVFVDPDNEIANSMAPQSKNGPKYVFLDDIRQFTELGKSLVIYHHLGRWSSADEQIKFWAERLRDHLGLDNPPWALRFRRGSARVYFVIPSERHRELLCCRRT